MQKLHPKKLSSVILIMSVLVLFSSCAKLPIYKSEQLSSGWEQELANIATPNYNKSNNVNYGVANTESHLIVKAVFHEQESMIKMMRGGLIFYFDPNGKKGKDYSLKIERSEQQSMERRPQQQQSSSGNREIPMQDMSKRLNETLSKVTWNANGNEYVFYRGFQKEKIEVEITSNQFNEMQVLVIMPLSELPIPETNLMSMAIATGSVSSNSNGQSGGGRGMRSSGGMGGGPGGGGGMGGGPSGGGMGGGPGGQSGGQSSMNSSPIQIWFQVEL